MKSLFFIILLCLISFPTIVAQSTNNSEKTYEVVSADGTTKTVTAEEANSGISDRLKGMRDEQERTKRVKNIHFKQSLG